MSQLNWTEAQWNKVNNAITEEFTKASVAGASLPCYGPMGAGTETVSNQDLSQDPTVDRGIIRIKDDTTSKFWTLAAYVELTNQQVSDENLGSALFAFRRAANLLARSEDYVVFQGYDTTKPAADAWVRSVVQTKENASNGLIKIGPNNDLPETLQVGPRPNYGENLVTQITEAVARLEGKGYAGPFACILGKDGFVEAHRPVEKSMVLPADRITPMLAGPLLRSGSMPADAGVVIPTTSESIDLVVATQPKGQFLQVNQDAKFIFRVYERFALRIKDVNAVIRLELVKTI